MQISKSNVLLLYNNGLDEENTDNMPNNVDRYT